jgi:methionine aminopeptidase, type I (EC 3.4.11.18)
MINIGTERIKYLEDNWTIVTQDNKLSAHFEHDVAVVDGKPTVLSTFDYVEKALVGKNIV